MFGTVHNSFSFMSSFSFCQTFISKTVLWIKLFFLFSHKDMSWNKAEKISLLHLSPSFLSLNYA